MTPCCCVKSSEGVVTCKSVLKTPEGRRGSRTVGSHLIRVGAGRQGLLLIQLQLKPEGGRVPNACGVNARCEGHFAGLHVCGGLVEVEAEDLHHRPHRHPFISVSTGTPFHGHPSCCMYTFMPNAFSSKVSHAGMSSTVITLS